MILVSACLYGINCRYDGNNLENPYIKALVNAGQAFPVCPEQLGGLSTPRTPCEIISQEGCSVRVMSENGTDCTKAFNLGANRTLAVAKALGVTKAILKSRSPSCGRDFIYDGSFNGNVVSGRGLTAKLLMLNDIAVFTEHEIDQFRSTV